MNRKKRTHKKRAGAGNRRKKEWSMGDFVSSVYKVMEEQAEKNETLKMLHARLEPEWNKVTQKITELVAARGQEEITERVEEIVKFGEKAVRPLVDYIVKMRR